MCTILDPCDVYKLLLDATVTRDKRSLMKNLNFYTLQTSRLFDIKAPTTFWGGGYPRPSFEHLSQEHIV